MSSSIGSGFKDLFSQHARAYALYRPTYPEKLFDYLAGLCDEKNLAWDCATGNGQAALPLAKYFSKVVATDASSQQISKAEAHPKIEYRCTPAENSGLADASVNLITVAQALHWFKREPFNKELRRVAKPGAIFAAWTYAICRITPEIDEAVDYLYNDVLEKYWDPARKHVEDGYRSFKLPIVEIQPPEFQLVVEWDLPSFRGYLMTWSATQKYIANTGSSPLFMVDTKLNGAWGDPTTKHAIEWPLALRVGRIK